ncbi:MAG: hypothetical protein WC007_04885 [Pelobacteraceae bacterium]
MIPEGGLRERLDAAAEDGTDEGVADLRAEGDEGLPRDNVRLARKGVVGDQRAETVGTDQIGLELRYHVLQRGIAAGPELFVGCPLRHHAGGPADIIAKAAARKNVTDAVPHAAGQQARQRLGNHPGIELCLGKLFVVRDFFKFKRHARIDTADRRADGRLPFGIPGPVYLFMSDTVNQKNFQSAHKPAASFLCGDCSTSYSTTHTQKPPISTMHDPGRLSRYL